MNASKVRAIVLRSRDFGEADRVLTVISAEVGVFDAKVKGARKPKSKSGPACGQFSTVDLSLVSGRTMDTVTEASLVKVPGLLEREIFRLSYASLAAEITIKMSEEKQPDRRAYALIDGALDALRAGLDPATVASAFMVKRLYIDGVLPHLTACARCRTKDDLHWFSAEAGGSLCPSCAAESPAVMRLEPESRRMALELYRATWEEISSLSFDEGTKCDLEAALSAFFSYRGDIRLRSLETIAMLRGETFRR